MKRIKDQFSETWKTDLAAPGDIFWAIDFNKDELVKKRSFANQMCGPVILWCKVCRAVIAAQQADDAAAIAPLRYGSGVTIMFSKALLYVYYMVQINRRAMHAEAKSK